MRDFFKYLTILVVFVIVSGFSGFKNDAVVKKGNVIYSFESGKMQCLSEVDSSGKIVILLKSLEKNTEVKFGKIDSKNPRKQVLVATMLVQEDTDLCASWTNMQEVNIAIDPKPVEKITLSGNTVYNAGNITVLTLK